jgi:hypothetical protein
VDYQRKYPSMLCFDFPAKHLLGDPWPKATDLVPRPFSQDVMMAPLTPTVLPLFSRIETDFHVPSTAFHAGLALA